MDEFMGIIKLFAGNYAPQGWALCNGQLLAVKQYAALYTILGTTYGGDGVTTFALPNLSGRVAVGAGSGSGLPPVPQGQAGGTASVTLTVNNLPAHSHLPQVANVAATTSSPAGNVLAIANGADGDGNAVTVNAYAPAASLVAGSPAGNGTTGGGQPISVMPPYLGLNYIICLTGLFPPRS